MSRRGKSFQLMLVLSRQQLPFDQFSSPSLCLSKSVPGTGLWALQLPWQAGLLHCVTPGCDGLCSVCVANTLQVSRG